MIITDSVVPRPPRGKLRMGFFFLLPSIAYRPQERLKELYLSALLNRGLRVHSDESGHAVCGTMEPPL